MTPNEVAAHYIRYLYKDGEGRWRVADNAPSKFQLFLQTLPKGTDSKMLHAVIEALVSHRTIQAPPADELIDWVKESANAARRCDEILQKEKGKIATLGILLTKAWVAEAHQILDRLHKFFSA